MAATVSKSSKINFYKFVQVKDPSSASAKKPGAAQENKIALALNSNTRAVNNLGATVNSLAKVLTDLKKVAIIDLEREQKRQSSFTAKFAKEKEERSKPLVGGILGAGKVKGFLESLLGALSGLFKFFVGTKVLEWLSDPKNKKMIEDGLDIIGKIGKFIWDWAKFSVTSTIDGLYNLFRDDTTWWEKVIGFGKAIVGVGSAILLIRYLTNPTKIITDITKGVGALIKFVTGGGRRNRRPRSRGRGALRAVLGVGATAVAGYGLYKSMQDDGPPEEKAGGGKVKKGRAGGGWINGPMSGYPVSLDGGRSTSFIGHGREYVAQKAGGGAFVVPFNTPATQRMSGLTGQRITEAKKAGYKLPGFASGGEYLNQVKSRDGTSGPGDAKKIFLHWSAGGLNNTDVYQNKYGYHSYLTTTGVVNKSKYGSNWPFHTYNQNGPNSAALGIAGGANNTEYGNNWGANAPKMSQYWRMAKEAAALAANWGWKESDITESRVRTHWEENRDHPEWYYKPEHYRWDLRKLMPQDALGSGPDKIRRMIKAEFRKFKGGGGKKQTTHDDSSFPLGGFGRRVAGMVDALTGNRTDFDKMGSGSKPPKVTSPTGGADSSKPRKVLKGDSSINVGTLPAKPTRKQAFNHIYKIAKKVGGTKWPEIVAAQAMHETGYLVNPNSVFFASNKTNPFGQTGDRGYGTLPRAGDPAGWTLYPNLETAVRDHIKLWHDVGNNSGNYNAFNSALEGIASVAPAYSPNADPANIRLGYTVDGYSKGMVEALKVGGFDPKTKRTGGAPAVTPGGTPPTTPSGRVASDSAAGNEMDRAELKVQNLSNLLGLHSTRGMDYDTSSKLMPGTGIAMGESLDRGYNTQLQQATQDKINAKNEMVNGTTQTMQQIVSAVTVNNSNVGAAVQQATEQVSTLSKGSREEAPTIVGGGIDLIKSTASLLNSFNNPLKGILQ